MALSYRLTVRDAVHGNMWFTALERDIIDTLPFQRLRGLKQSSLAHYTYPTALTTRFEHSLGACHLAGKIIATVFRRDPRRDSFITSLEARYSELRSRCAPDEAFIDIFVQAVRLAALLHDIGHLPFSHCFEQTIDSFVRKSEPAPGWTAHDCQSLNDLSHRHQRHTGAGVLQLHEFLSYEIASKHPCLLRAVQMQSDSFAVDVHKIALQILVPPTDMESGHPVIAVFGRIVHGELDADRMDYISRDSGMAGSSFRFDIERLIDSLALHEERAANDSDSLRVFKLWPTVQGLSAVEGFFHARIGIHRWQYHHPNVVFADLCLRLVIQRLLQGCEQMPKARELLEDLSPAAFLAAVPVRSRSGAWLIRDDAFLWDILMASYRRVISDIEKEPGREEELGLLKSLLEEILFRHKQHRALWKDRIGLGAFFRLVQEETERTLRGQGHSIEEARTAFVSCARELDPHVSEYEAVGFAMVKQLSKESTLHSLQARLLDREAGPILIDYRDLTPFRRLPGSQLSGLRVIDRDGVSTTEMTAVSDLMAGVREGTFLRTRLFGYLIVSSGSIVPSSVEAARRDLARELVAWCFEASARMPETMRSHFVAT